MQSDTRLEPIWQELQPLLVDIGKTYKMGTVHAVQFRGYNKASVNSPATPNTIRLWVNLTNQTLDNAAMERRHARLLNKIWKKLLKRCGPNLDRVMVAPIGGKLYVAGFYPSTSGKSTDTLPYYQVPTK